MGVLKKLSRTATLCRYLNRQTVGAVLDCIRTGDYRRFKEGIDYYLHRAEPADPFHLELVSGSIDPMTPLSFPECAAPLVSIIVPVHNQWEHTHACLASILKYSGEIPYEVIVADDVSTDETVTMADRISGVRVVRNESNLGFLRNCNRAALQARGRYLHFLNNDTNVQPGWLESLVTLMEADPLIGIAGSMLVYPDGKLQEAGGILWQDGSGWNFGLGDSPNRPDYNYVKEVDYISGASIMVRRELWERVGGFDELFAPAYFEDADLAFRARALGYRVVLQPRSVVVHLEGVSHGRDISTGIKSYQARNREYFVDRWREVLERDHFPNGEHVLLARDRSRWQKKILVIDHYVPTPDKDAGSFFMTSLLRSLVSLGYHVVFWPDNLYRHEPYCRAVQQLGIEVIYGPQRLVDFLRQRSGYFDAAILTRNHIAINHIETVRAHIPRLLYHDPDFEYVRESRRMALEGGEAQELEKIREREFFLFEQSNVITTVNPDEVAQIEQFFPGKRVETIPHPIDTVPLTESLFESRCGLFFVGGTHTPNLDALVWFIREILPLVRDALPDVTFTVAGSVPPEKLKGLDLTNVELTGFLPDLRPCYEQARICVVPLRYGAGVKGKVVEAMNYGLPVVTTEIGAEGIGLNHGENVLIADTPELFSTAVVRLYQNTVLWEKLRRKAHDHVVCNFSQPVFSQSVRKAMESLLS